MVKFKNGPDDLTQIEIVLTDFGMADLDSKGGTPIFASPECFEKKAKKSDIFSFGRVILFLLLTKNQFIKWLFVPIKDETRILSLKIIRMSNVGTSKLYWISQMISIENRISLKLVRKVFDQFRQKSIAKLNDTLIREFDRIIDDELSRKYSYTDYLAELSDFRYEHTLKNSDVFHMSHKN